MADGQAPAGVRYASRGNEYFDRRRLRRYAGAWSLWALGVGAVISGHFSGWNLGFATGGWGGLMAAAIIVAIMYLGLVFSIAEMSPALPHTGAAYSFGRTAMGPWGGFVTGLFENVEYVMTPAVVVTFIGGYVQTIFNLPGELLPLIWIVFYLVFLGLNIGGVALSFRVTLAITLISLGVLVFFWISAIPGMDFNRWALNIAAGPDGEPVLLPEGGGSWFPFGLGGVFASLPFAVWLFLAIEQLPLAAEESVDPRRDMPRGILLGFATLLLSAFMIVWLNPSVPGVGAFALGNSLEPLLDGFAAIFGAGGSALLGLIALTGLIASFHTILFAQGRQIYSLSRAGYFPSTLSVTHRLYRTPHRAMIAGSILGLGVTLTVWYANGGAGSDWTRLSAVLLNMAVFGAMLSYIMQALSFILLRRNLPGIERPYVSPLGVTGALVTVAIALVTLVFQLTDPDFVRVVPWVLAWCAAGAAYFWIWGRGRLILSPEEEFALGNRARGR